VAADGEPDYVDIGCDCCDEINFSGQRFKCKTCSDVDLCEECFKTYPSNSLPHCKGHEFLEIPSQRELQRHEIKCDARDDKGNTLEEWMDDLSKRLRSLANSEELSPLLASSNPHDIHRPPYRYQRHSYTALVEEGMIREEIQEDLKLRVLTMGASEEMRFPLTLR
jgi:hypothetical protein